MEYVTIKRTEDSIKMFANKNENEKSAMFLTQDKRVSIVMIKTPYVQIFLRSPK